MTATSRLEPHVVREIAVAAFCDPRTMRKLAAGEHVRDLTARRIREALEKRGLSHLLPSAPSTVTT